MGLNADRYVCDENEKLLLDEAEHSYNRIMDAVTNNYINGIPTNAEPGSQILPLPVVQDGVSNQEILDTGDLSQFSFVYNDITFQVYPTLKLTNDRSSGKDILQRQDELDNTSLLDQE
jgi:hypothetical protein